MIIDTNMWLGQWPFHAKTDITPARLQELLRKEGIGKALVASRESVLIDDPENKNMDLLSQTKKLPDLLPVITVNPSLPNWKDKMPVYIEEGIKAVKLFPNYHTYSLSEPFVRELMNICGNEGILPILQMRLEDERSHHPSCIVPGVAADEIIASAHACPDVQLAVSCPYFDEAVSLVQETKNIHIDIAFTERLHTIPSLCKQIPAERILFGSHTPFLYTRAALMKAEDPDISNSDRKLITHKNITSLLHLYIN
ncbi:amidohydrolase family protein [Planctomycetota bacterium]